MVITMQAITISEDANGHNYIGHNYFGGCRRRTAEGLQRIGGCPCIGESSSASRDRAAGPSAIGVGTHRGGQKKRRSSAARRLA